MSKEIQDHQATNTDQNEDRCQYRWSYEAQWSLEQDQKKKIKKRGAWTYALIMTAVFAVCFLMLACTLIWYADDGKGPSETGVISTTEIAEQSYPSTVLIYARTKDAYRHGTGFFIRADGYIATNYHVLKDAVSIEVALFSGKKLEARLVGYDEGEDLAVLKISGISYPVLPIGNSDLIRVGERAIVIGNPSGPDAGWTTTQGIVSAVNRKIKVQVGDATVDMTFIQTDAPVNQGNSGGPLLNDQGQVIGIVNRKLAETEGIGFAIPINHAVPILDGIVQADKNK